MYLNLIGKGHIDNEALIDVVLREGADRGEDHTV